MRRILLIMVISACAGTHLSAQAIYSESDTHPRPPRVPAYIVFAGDTIRFDTPEKVERMDRELITFTYMQTLSTLMYRRCGRCFPDIEAVLSEYGVPDDMKYIAAIESGFDPKAHSPAGAVGMWQFTKATAKEYGLEVGTEVDQRYDVPLQTVAACKFLKSAYSAFNDWLLVSAGYNCGRAGVSRRISEQHRSSFFDLWLPEETTRYIYRLFAAKMFFSDPSAFGYSMQKSDVYPSVRFKTVTVSDPIPSLVEFADRYGVSYAALKRANPWLRDTKLTNKDHKTYQIRIPLE